MVNIDELIQLMEEDELADKLDAAIEGLIKMTAIEYARSKNIKPQLVYYYIRKGHVLQETCICGRKVIDVESANAYLQSRSPRIQGS